MDTCLGSQRTVIDDSRLSHTTTYTRFTLTSIQSKGPRGLSKDQNPERHCPRVLLLAPRAWLIVHGTSLAYRPFGNYKYGFGPFRDNVTVAIEGSLVKRNNAWIRRSLASSFSSFLLLGHP